ncbi:MAG: response regulator transcription factor [Bacteroidales bacterium]|nr:response regulator transcription factor [Bacteroidales bacterium]
MKKLKVFIVEDEIPAQMLLEKWIEKIPEFELSGIYSDGFSALKAINELKPDLIFLDIEMPKITGIEMLELIDEPPLIIFTTAYHEFAVRAFELSAIDYLLKPFTQDRFKQAVLKAINTQEEGLLKMRKSIPELHKQLKKKGDNDRVIVKDGTKIHIIPIIEITHIESQDDYVMIYTKDNNYLKLASLQSLEEVLPPKEFVRVHRSFILNINAVSKIENYTKDTYHAILLNGKNVKISKSGLTLLREILYL